MEDRRQFARLNTSLPVTYRVISSIAPASTGAAVSGRPPGQSQTRTKDVSSAGICVFLEKPLPIGTRLDIHITLPDPERPVSCVGDIVWCDAYEFVGATAQAPWVQAGVKLVQIDAQDHQRILRHVILHMQP